MEKVASKHNPRQYVKCSHIVGEAKRIEVRQKCEVKTFKTDGGDLMFRTIESHDGESG